MKTFRLRVDLVFHGDGGAGHMMVFEDLVQDTTGRSVQQWWRDSGENTDEDYPPQDPSGFHMIFPQQNVHAVSAHRVEPSLAYKIDTVF